MSQLKIPEYRVRLFLSVDLTGSTAFKAKNTSFDWLKEFQKFYASFLALYSENYSFSCDDIDSMDNADAENCPKLWKTIGDEILFVNRVHSISHLSAYVSAFSKTLMEFADKFLGEDLDTKGNGWIAAFPSPNCSIGIGGDSTIDPIAGINDLPSEQLEADVDENPRKYDFLGKGIDGGFRISKNSNIDTFTISPALAYLLSKAKTNPDVTKFTGRFRFHEPQPLKGVLDGKRYPIISLDTQRHQVEKELSQLETELLKRPHFADDAKLRTYLEAFITHHEIEMPSLKMSNGEPDQPPPEHYQHYAQQWKREYDKKNSK
ncbi:hypothetical protein [Planktotalea sp.]|uniref:hypothetical protein n=1 Tax=Planktotalea sp. TaxID=2029877 RepID=UPI0025FA1384|nr:hypothetical protein [Planktotalea sp.]